MPYRFAVPGAIERRLNERRGNSSATWWDTCRNLYLLLHQYAPYDVIRQEEEGARGEWLTSLAERTKAQSRNPIFDRDLHKAWLSRWERMAEGRQANRFQAHCAARVVVGLGGQTPIETDLLVHPVYGIPYIPGSALKGLTRAYGRLEGLVAPDDETRIFGTQERSGAVVFLDAAPVRVALDVDIMNPHYPRYYRDTRNRTPASDDQSPIPVVFLTVAAGSEFRFAVAPRPGSGAGSRADVEMAVGWLQGALREYGVGAKTNAGYGRFEVIPEK